MLYKKLLLGCLTVLAVVTLAVVYKTHNPIESSFFPKCPFLTYTGFQCPGCGSQRAVHHLLNLEVYEAMKENPLLVISIPYILTGVAFDRSRQPGIRILKWRRRLFGRTAILVILVLIICFWVLRNAIS